VYPVSGRVTTPAAYVTPERLELGTACAGVPVRATVSLVNSGTARLAVEPPLLDPSFVAQPESPTSYPAPLAAGATAILGIAPAAREPGPYAGKLTWRADAPAAPFVVPVSLTYIETGTAISPARLSFAPIQVTETSPRFTVTLQNCNTAPVVVSIDGIKADRGGAAAWQVVPSAERRLLAPQERLALSVAFSPRRHGRHAARIELVIGGEPASVALEGDGIDASFERTSFYACSCGGGEAPGGGAIALAAGVAAAVLRRRRPRRDRAAPMRSAR
jgi:MYXO-CTERM domain-containing protein